MAQKIPHPPEPGAVVTAVILAGGAGSRAGHRDKGTVTWRGKPLVAHVRDSLAPQVDALLISCNRNADFYADYADTTFADLREDYQGPLAGLEAARPHVCTEFVLFAPCDTAGLPQDLVQRLLAAVRAQSLEGAYARCSGRDHYLCLLLRRDSLESVARFLDDGGRAVWRWLQQHRIEAVDFGEHAELFQNINDP